MRSRRTGVRAAVLAAASVLASASVHAAVIHVPGDAATIQTGLNLASIGDTVLVAAGTYAGDGNRDLDYHGRGIVLLSASGPDSTRIECGGSSGNEHRAVRFDEYESAAAVFDGFTITGGYINSGGAVFCKNSSPTIRNCVIRGNTAWGNGGGIFCRDSSSPQISHCTITGNHAGYITGGGVYALNSSFPTLDRCIVSHSVNSDGVGCYGGSGATLTCCDVFGNAGGNWIGCIETQLGVAGNLYEDPHFCSPGLEDYHLQTGSPCEDAAGCGLIGALAAGCGPGPGGRTWLVLPDGTGDAPTIQGAIDLAASGLDTILVAQGVFTGHGNRDIDPRGKALIIRSADGPATTVIDCEGEQYQAHRGFYCASGEGPSTVIDGFTIRGGYDTSGGGIYCLSASPTLRNCVICDNEAGGYGGGIYCRSICSPRIVSCTIVQNRADGGAGGGVYALDGAAPELENCIVAFSERPDGVACLGGTVTLRCCDVYGNAGGDWVGCIAGQAGTEGNFSEDPLLCARHWGDFHLQPGSPCEDAPGCGLVGALPAGCGAIPEPHTWVVNPDGSGDATTIQAGIDLAAWGDTVLVAPGTYTGEGNRDLDLHGLGIRLRSADGPATTVIDCEGQQYQAHRGFYCASDETRETVIDGFTIRGGYDTSGGGIYCVLASPTIRNCVICDNEATGSGGGVFCQGGGSPRIVSSTIAQNQADGAAGGGVYATSGAAPELENCIVAFSYDSDGVACLGSGTVTLRCCDVYGNASGDWVGCIADQAGADGNFSEDPLLCGRHWGDFHLQPGSPCENAPGCGLVGALPAGCGPVPEAHTWVVNPDGSGDATTIQAGIDLAAWGDTVHVVPGTYTGAGNRDLDFHGLGIYLRSADGPATTVINCQGSASHARRGFHFANGETPETVIDGFTIRGGYNSSGGGIYCVFASPTIRNCVICDNRATGNGGGIFCQDGGSPRIVSSTIAQNRADAVAGGGVCALNGATPELENCIVAFSDRSDAIVCSEGGTATLRCCDVYGNAGGDWLGCIADQAGMNGNFSEDPLLCGRHWGDFHLEPGSPCENSPGCGLVGALPAGCGAVPEAHTWVVNADGSGNATTIQAGINLAAWGDTVLVVPGTYAGSGNRDLDFHGLGIYLRSQSGPASTVLDCGAWPDVAHRAFYFAGGEGPETVVDGFTVRNALADYGGAIYCNWSSPAIRSCIFEDNYATNEGGAVACVSNAAPLFLSCTFFGNGAQYGGAALLSYGNAAPVLEGCILAFGERVEAVDCGGGGVATLSCCDIYGNQGGDWVGGIAGQGGGNGNFSEDPLLCDPWMGDFHLQSGSPCAAAPGCGLVGALDVGCGPPPPPRTWLVREDGAGDAPTIQAAIDLARSGQDTVLVAPGTYAGNGNRDLDLRGKDLRVVSRGGPDSTTIICGGTTSHTHRGFFVNHGESSRTEIEGFTVMAGYADLGGAVYSGRGSRPTIRCSVFSGNGASQKGGGVACFSGGSLTLASCTLYWNQAASSGGGLYAEGAWPILEGCIVAFSRAGGAVGCGTGGQADLACCNLYGNTGGDWTGQIAGEADINGNFSEDPLFCDPASGDLRLHQGSPCEDAAGCGLVGALPVGCPPLPLPRTWVVRPDGSGDAPTLQAAVNLSSNGDTILVTAGLYTGAGNREITFGGKALLVKAESGPDSTVLYCATEPSTFYRGFRFYPSDSPSTVIDGFTIRNGRAQNGGAIYCDGASPTIRNCVLADNYAEDKGGAVACLSYGAPAISSCTFYGNGARTSGSALYCWNQAAPVLDRCILAFGRSGGATYCSQGGRATLSCCDVYGNAGGDWTGCIAGQLGVNNNFSADPLFCGPYWRDARIEPGSPCADAPVCDRVGALPAGCGPPHTPRTWVVSLDGSGDATAIQIGIDRAWAGDTVLVMPGVYEGAGNRDLDLRGMGLCLRSASGPASTVIQCDGVSSGVHRAFCFDAGESAATVVEGFTLTGGYATTGGAILCQGSSPTIRNCLLSGNRASNLGGGIYCTSAACPSLRDVIIEGNIAAEKGGGLACDTGASPSLLRCRIAANQAVGNHVPYGGGLAATGACHPVLESCILSGNSASWGGGCWLDNGATGVFTGCTFVENWAYYGGGVCLQRTATATLDHTILAFQEAGAPVWCDSGTSATLSCCDIYGNLFGDWVGCIADQHGLRGNMRRDPLFCDRENGDFSIQSESPCAAENNSAGCDLVGALDVGCGMTEVAEKPPVPETFALFANVPNPFNPVTEIGYAIPAGPGSSRVELTIYNALGQRVRTLVDEEKPAGFYRATWDGKDDARAAVASGVYFYRLTWNGRSETRRMVLLK